MKMLHGGADGSTKDIISTDYELSSRSYAYVAADSSVYLYGRGTRSDGYSPAWNGFFGQIQGWSVGEKDYTGQLYYPYGTDSPEWKYFGSVPYDLGPTAIPIADDGSTFLVVPDRSTLHRAQTPQGFDLQVIRSAYDIGLQDPNFQATDDCGIVLRYRPDIPVRIVMGEEQNMKVTYQGDLPVLETYL